MLDLNFGRKGTLLLGQVSNIEHDALLVVKNDFAALETEDSLSKFLSKDVLLSLFLTVGLLLLLIDLKRLAYQEVGEPF